MIADIAEQLNWLEDLIGELPYASVDTDTALRLGEVFCELQRIRRNLLNPARHTTWRQVVDASRFGESGTTGALGNTATSQSFKRGE